MNFQILLFSCIFWFRILFLLIFFHNIQASPTQLYSSFQVVIANYEARKQRATRRRGGGLGSGSGLGFGSGLLAGSLLGYGISSFFTPHYHSFGGFGGGFGGFPSSRGFGGGYVQVGYSR